MTQDNSKAQLVERLRRGVTWSDGKPIGAVVGEVNDPIMREAADLIEALTRPQPSTSSVEAVARAIMEAQPYNLSPDEAMNCARAVLALPSPEREPMREALVRAYKQGALDVHEAWVEGLGEENAPSRDPDFAEAAYDYADAALAPPTAQSGDRT